MNILTSLLLSGHELWYHPHHWWAARHWSFKLLLTLAVIPTISATSIWAYQAQNQITPSQLTEFQQTQYPELIALKHQLQAVQRTQEELLAQLEPTNPTMAVLGTSSASNSSLISELQDYQDKTAAKITTLERDQTPGTIEMVFVPKRTSATTELYQEPTEHSLVLTTIPTNTWYVVVGRENSWYQLELDETNLTGWVPSSLVQELPK